mmetsp:Transcript_9067/g.28317  ORF Transcript_9067/g.28317 Transcript_9067/m.28317 type:complete len:210 (+) Transcript_9067:251-880(+)
MEKEALPPSYLISRTDTSSPGFSTSSAFDTNWSWMLLMCTRPSRWAPPSGEQTLTKAPKDLTDLTRPCSHSSGPMPSKLVVAWGSCIVSLTLPPPFFLTQRSTSWPTDTTSSGLVARPKSSGLKTSISFSAPTSTWKAVFPSFSTRPRSAWPSSSSETTTLGAAAPRRPRVSLVPDGSGATGTAAAPAGGSASAPSGFGARRTRKSTRG